MKKLIIMLAAMLPLFVFSACSDDEDGGSGSQTFFVNVYSKYGFEDESDKELVNQAFVYLYSDEGKSIDTEESAESVVKDGVLTYSDGSDSEKPKYSTGFQPGVFNFENIENGNYILWVVYMYDYAGICYSSYKKIAVNEDYRGTTEEKIFTHTDDMFNTYRFQAW